MLIENWATLLLIYEQVLISRKRRKIDVLCVGIGYSVYKS